MYVGRDWITRRYTQLGGADRSWWTAAVAVVTLLTCTVGLVVWIVAGSYVDARNTADVTLANLAAALARDIDRNIELYDLALEETLQALLLPGLAKLTPELRHAILFNSLAGAPYFGPILVIDAAGNVEFDSGSVQPPRLNVTDRDYFSCLGQSDETGLVICRSRISPVSHQETMLFVRRRVRPDGSFAGLIAAGIRLSYFQTLFAHLNLGTDGVVTLTNTAGVVLGSWPKRDGVQRSRATGRLSADRQIGSRPLMVTVAMSPVEVFASWRAKSAITLVTFAVLMSLSAVLALSLRRQFSRREQAQADARQAAADAISAEAIARECEQSVLRLNEKLEKRIDEAVAAREAAIHRASASERMQALGQLASGIAHDFNNVIQSVSSCAELLNGRADDADRVRQLARLIEDSTQRAAAITRRLLTFARQDGERSDIVDVPGLVRGLTEILSHTLGAQIEVRGDVVRGLPQVRADRGELDVVLLNLATNARDAMPTGGMLTLKASCEVIALDNDLGLSPGTYVRIAMTDTGTGMDVDTLGKATDRFFSTKPHGQGTGLGLAMAKSFAEASAGALTIGSGIDQGTVIGILLPAIEPTDGTGCSSVGSDDLRLTNQPSFGA